MNLAGIGGLLMVGAVAATAGAQAGAIGAGEAASRANVVYVIDGTASRAEHADVLWRVHARINAAATDTARYWEGVKDIVAARDAGALRDEVFATICRDVQPRSAGGLGARNVYLLGFSRGAIIAIRVANEARRQCGAHVVFLGLVDAVSTSMPTWPLAVDSGIPVAVHLVKPRNTGAVFLTTAKVRGVTVLAHPDRGARLTGWGAISHERLVCPVGHERDLDGRQATWTEARLVEQMQRAATLTGEPLRIGNAIPPSCPPGWRKFVSDHQRPPMTVDVAVGVGSMHRGHYMTSMSPTVSIGAAALAPSGLVMGISASAMPGVPVGDKCEIAPAGGCVPELPRVFSLSALAGREHAFGRSHGLPGSVRLSAGPGLYRVGVHRNAHNVTLGGAEAHLDFTVPGSRVALLISAQASWIPALPYDARGTRSLNLGVRFR